MIQYFVDGGPMMWPLLAVALFSVAAIFERFMTFSRIPKPKQAEKQLQVVEDALRNGGMEECVKVVAKGKGILNYIFARLLKRYDMLVVEKKDLDRVLAEHKATYQKNDVTAYMADNSEVEEFRGELHLTIEDASRSYVSKWLAALNTSATIAPLIGLLGTVTGMIAAFNSISASGTGDPRVVAGGISQALITTATGLIIAIPVTILHRWLGGKAEASKSSVEVYALAFSNTLLAMLREKK
jgi:biopolymer transport protein ExbB